MSLARDPGAITPTASNFRRYSEVYDLLYRDKDYAAEADYVAHILRSTAPQARNILELGSGSGRHGHLLAAAGFHVHGIERSPDMLRLADLVPRRSDAGSFSCELGDVRSAVVDRRFDAAIALFHVISYQTTDNDLRAAFDTAARHIKTGGLFLFDVWHGPAVLMQRPERRLKSVGNDELEVIRMARPQLDTVRRTVKVTYDIECRDRHSGSVTHFTEDHLMRYLFPDEIASFASQSGMRVIASKEFITGRPPSSLTWSVAYVLRK